MTLSTLIGGYRRRMDSDALASLYAEVVRGVAKSASRFAGKSAEASRSWDEIAAEVARIRADNPEAQFDVPNEIPRAV